MKHESIWHTLAESHSCTALDKDASVDTAIIGGGITGLRTAQQLSENGRRTAVLEARTIGSGPGGTGKPLHEIETKDE